MIEQGVQAFVVRGDNSVKAIPLSSWMPSEMTGLAPSSAGPHEVYRRVPAVYRCVSARAHAVSRVPFDVERAGRATLKADRDEVARWIKRHLYQIEASLCLDGGAYLMPERNKVKLLGLRWLRFDTVTPLLDSRAGLAGFSLSANTFSFGYSASTTRVSSGDSSSTVSLIVSNAPSRRSAVLYAGEIPVISIEAASLSRATRSRRYAGVNFTFSPGANQLYSTSIVTVAFLRSIVFLLLFLCVNQN
jgi:hypothetical protein